MLHQPHASMAVPRSAARRRKSLRDSAARRQLLLESLESRLLLAIDFGDAPASYATLNVDNGAQHEAIGAGES